MLSGNFNSGITALKQRFFRVNPENRASREAVKQIAGQDKRTQT